MTRTVGPSAPRRLPRSADLGIPVGDVALRAGHSSTKMTQDRYGHAMPHADQRALDRLAAAKAARRGLRVVS